VQQEFLIPHGWTFLDGLLPYNNPPFFALIFVPLSFLPLAWAFHIWNIANILLILASIRLLLRQQRKRSNRDLIAASLIAFAFFPTLQGLVNGQSSFLILIALVLTYLGLKGKRDYLAGTTLALGLIKPQLVIVIIAVMLYRQRWRTVLAFGVTTTILLLASVVTVGIEGMVSYVALIRQMLSSNGFHGLHPAPMPNLRGTVYRFGQLYHACCGGRPSSVTLNTITLLLSTLVFVSVLRAWRGPWDPTSHEFDLRFSQTLIGTLLFSPHLYSHDLSLLILVAFLLLNYFAHEARRVWAYGWIAIGHIAALLSFISMGGVGQAQVIAFLLISFMIIIGRELNSHPGSLPSPRLTPDPFQSRGAGVEGIAPPAPTGLCGWRMLGMGEAGGMMSEIRVENLTRGRTLVTKGRVADTFWRRLRGLMGSRPLKPGEGVLVVPCRAIHTHFMRFPIDVLYVNAAMEVIGIDEKLPPWHFGAPRRHARFVIELPAGTVEATGTRLGDRLEVRCPIRRGG